MLHMIALLLLACSGSEKESGSDPETTGCDDDSGVITGVVYEFEGAIVPAATVYLLPDGGDVIETRADDDGTFTAQLPAGTWSLSAEDRQGCFTGDYVIVDLAACAGAEVELIMELWAG